METKEKLKHKEILKQFYKQLGRLLYSVAIVDDKVQREELKTLKDFVTKELAFLETTSDSSGMNQAFYSYFEFEDCLEKKMSMEDAHASFIKFVDENLLEIDSALLDKSIKAIDKIASSYRQINKKEKVLIDKIKLEIRDLTDLF